MNEARRVCLFGGSFNPPHVGHVFLSAWALSTRRFDELRWVPANAHAFGKELASFDERMEMCRRAIAVLDDRVTVSDVERRIGGQSRTIVTLEHLEAEEPGTTFTLLMGADLLQQLPRWERGAELLERFETLVIGRSGHEESRGLPVTLPDISSHAVRDAVSEGRWSAVEGCVTHDVVAYIRERGLYVSD